MVARGDTVSAISMASAAALAVAVVLGLPGCNAPDSVAKFASSAVTALQAGDAIFDDMKASCIREAETREAFGSFSLADPSSTACDDIGKQAEGLKAASAVVSSYFKALNDLASFGKTKAGADAKDQAAKASAHAKLSAARQAALGSVADFLARAALGGYQQKQLAEDIAKVHEDVGAVLEGLGEASGVVYYQQLADQQQKTAARYKEFLLQYPQHPDIILGLDSRWQADRTAFTAKEKAARSYQAAVNLIAKGNDDLVAHAARLRTKELTSLLSPYATQLESLAPAIQKALF